MIKLIRNLFTLGIPILCLALFSSKVYARNNIDDITEFKSPLIIADKAFREKRYHEALNLYQKIQDKGTAHYCSGMCYEMLSRPDKAIEEYRAAIFADPSHYRAMENLAGILERSSKDTRLIIALYKKALELDPREEWRQNLITWIRIQESRMRPIEDYAVGCFYAARGAELKGDSKTAEHMYSQAVNKDPNLHPAFFARGMLRLGINNTVGALYDFEETVRLAPKFRGAYLQLGLFHESTGNSLKALECLAIASQNDPNDPQALFHYGRLAENNGDLEKAVENYARALSLPGAKSDLKRQIAERLASVTQKKPEIKKKTEKEINHHLW